MSRRAPRAVAFALGVALALGASATALAADDSHDVRFLVQAERATPSRATLARDVPSVRVRAVRPLARDLAVVTARVARGSEARAAAALGAAPSIVAATVDRRTGLAGTRAPVRPKDTLFPDQWDLWDARSTLRAGGYGVDGPRAWTRTVGSPAVVVAVLDTGITAHPDLAGASLAPGYDFVSGADGVGAGDGDGWDADPADPGDACASAGEPSSWHGTFVAGELVARHGNGGVAGLAPGVTVEPVRVLGSCGGSEADMVAAIEWASGGVVPGVPVNARPARVLSMSLGTSSGGCPAAVQTAIDDATARGAVVVAAAGNDGGPVAATSPADCRGVVSVVASTRSGDLAGYSNRGTAALRPTLAAPGGSSASPVLGDGWSAAGSASQAGNRPVVVAEWGTSMAAPRVAAAAALLLSVDPALPAGQVAGRLTRTATRFPAGSTCTAVRCGAGLVDAGTLVGVTARLVHSTSARITGPVRVGGRLTAHPGAWRPHPGRLKYRWLRDGTPIGGATAVHYRVRAGDAGHRLAVRVTATRTGAAPATAAAPARRVPRRVGP